MIAACCVKSSQTVNRMRALVAEGITEKDWTETLIKKTFEEPNPDKEDDTALTAEDLDISKLSSSPRSSPTATSSGGGGSGPAPKETFYFYQSSDGQVMVIYAI